MECPRCGLFNPDSASRCDCGYDFKSKTVEKPFFTQELPKEIRNYRTFLKGGYPLGILAVWKLSDNMASSLAIAGLWAVLIYSCYVYLVGRRNWARIALVVLTFPIGLLLLSSEVRLYCLQSKA